jgi:hypothetical protein
MPPKRAQQKSLNFSFLGGPRKYFPRVQTLKLKSFEGSKPDDIEQTRKIGPFSVSETLNSETRMCTDTLPYYHTVVLRI